MNQNRLYFLLIVLFFISITMDAQTGKPQYVIRTEQGGEFLGEITIELFPLIAPLHSANFDSLVNIQFYDTTAFHRVIPDFVIQGGDPNSRHGDPDTWGEGDSTQVTIPAEFSGVSHQRGIIGAARDVDINSANSQFYINMADNSSLDWNYTAYGRVLEGMDIADSIVNVPRDLSTDRPDDKIEMFITKGGFTNEIPAIPILTFPEEETSGLLVNDSLKWETVEDAAMYRLQISESENFDSLFIEAEVGMNYYRITDLQLGNVHYFWRVRANNGGNISEYSEVKSFYSSIEAAILLYPETGADSVSITPEFSWIPVEGATAYRLQISRSPIFPAKYIVYDVDTITTTTHVSSSLEDGKSHYWRVYSLTDEYQGPKSEFRRFVTASVVSVSNDQDIPTTYALGQNYPNPFNPSTTIKYQIPTHSGQVVGSGFSLRNVTLKVYDILGHEVTTLVNKQQQLGNYEIHFDASGLTSGI